ncbi:rod shape-determining protein RodA [Patescibacteria group bacterium]|nr:rod shape-determining protein RodA [Patescibacteria group bacterium]
MPVKKILFNLKYFDWQLLVVAIILISFGLASLYSVALSRGEQELLNFKKQIVFFILGLILIFLLSFFDYSLLQSYSLFFYIASAGLLILVLFLGITLRGTTGWFNIFGVNFQPVEIAKLALIIFLADLFSREAKRKDFFSFIMLSGFSALLLFVLVLLQPDFGSAVVLFLIWLLMVLAIGVRKSYLVILTIILILSVAMAWFFVFADYQKDRIRTFLDPSSDPYGRGYHVTQSVIAIGAGGFLGRGLGFGSQSQLKFIPAAQTDFIFAVLGEELGLLGVGLVMLCFGYLFYRILKIARSAPTDFGLFLCLGIGALFFSQFFINTGMNLGIMPVTGISLPFLSYGGSFLVMTMVMIGILESIAIRSIKYRV